MTGSNQSQRPCMNLESLEDRLALSNYVYNGDLIILGTNARDSVEVHQFSSWGERHIEVVENGRSTNYLAREVWHGNITFKGYGGNDYINNYAGDLNLWAWGGEGDDVLVGDAGNDHLFGEGGSDRLSGYWGDDDLRGGWGLDYVYGGDGNDWMDGGAGDGFIDHLDGGRGADGYCISYWTERDNCVGYNPAERDWTYWV